MKTILSFVSFLLLGYGLLVGLVYFFQSRMIYFSNVGAGSGGTPADVGLPYDDVIFETADGLRLHGWYISAEKSRAVMLFMHGNAGDITHRLDSISLFHDLGLSVFIFDYRGYGESEGKTDEQGTYRDAEAAWHYLVEERGIEPERVVIFGRSLGASIAAWLAAHNNPAVLIIEAAFTSVPDLAAGLYWYLPVRLLARIRYDTRSYVTRVSSPTLILHSADDEIIPLAHGERLFASANQPKAFVTLRGGHNDAFLVSRNLYVETLDAFLANAGLRRQPSGAD